MSSYFKTKVGSELGKSNGFIRRVMLCKSYREIYEWFRANPRNIVLDDIKYHREKFDLTDEKYKTVKQIIDKLEQMIS